MSGDVQPRKRKDKKRKKDELGVEEPRGTAAALGEGDVFMHSHHEHGTGGHWCAKIIFFSLLAILITLIGLIILENRGLSELEANSVESRYSGVLEGWLEDVPDDDHHDEHTLELTHHDDDDDHDEEIDHNIDDDHHSEDDASDEEEHGGNSDEDEELEDDDHELSDEDADEENNDGDDDDDEESQPDNDSEEQEQNYEDDDEELDHEDDEEAPEGDENDESEEIDENDSDENLDGDHENEVDDAIDDDSDKNEIDQNESEENDDNENQYNNEDEEDHEEEEEDDQEVEVEKLEREASEEEHEPISVELPALPEDDDDDDPNDDQSDDGKDSESDDDSGIEDEGEEFLEMDDPDEPPVERITVPAGKPFVEVEEEVSSEQPPDTLEEEEEYEKRQEELRREEAQASHMWLKLGVGAALLVATHAVMRRATHSRDAPESDDHASREETPVVDRRMTLIEEEPPVPARRVETVSRPVVMEQVIEKMTPIVKSIPIRKQDSEEEEEEEEEKEISEDEEEVMVEKPDDKELFSEDEADEEVEEEEEEIVVAKKEAPKLSAPVVAKKPEPEPEPEEEIEDDPDVEIIGDEQLEEELEEEEDEEEISDVDDVELLSRLEAKYGRLPEPERPGQKHKDGGNSVDDLWPGEPSDSYWRQQLDSAEQELNQSLAAAPGLRGSGRARYIIARALDKQAEEKRDNRLLTRSIQAYLELLKMNERLSDKKLLEITGRTLDRIQFRGNYLSAEPVYRLLIRRFPNEPAYRNNLTISFLMANRVDLAEVTLKETLQRWPQDRVALAHHGFVLKTKHNKYEEAAEAFRVALEGDSGPANEARFYYHYGDSLLLLGKKEEAHEVHKRGAKLGHFLSPSQRSLYNVPRLKSSPWWEVEKTPYAKLAQALERSWREILKEGEAAKALYEQEKEGLKERGSWSQLDLFVRGREVPGRCARAPATCAAVRAEPAAAACRRGQVKFSSMAAGTHVRAHVGPTNCRLRMHLGLSHTKDTYIRVGDEIRQWQEGKVLMFDDSFEHEVWHNGTRERLVLIVDVWHPDLTPAERATLPAI